MRCTLSAACCSYNCPPRHEHNIFCLSLSPLKELAWYKKAAGMMRNDLDVAYYRVRCSSRDSHTVAWEVHHRYSDFCELYETLNEAGLLLDGLLPRQHLFRASADPEVIAEREVGLDAFLREVTKLALDEPKVRAFLDMAEVEAQLKQKARGAACVRVVLCFPIRSALLCSAGQDSRPHRVGRGARPLQDRATRRGACGGIV